MYKYSKLVYLRFPVSNFQLLGSIKMKVIAALPFLASLLFSTTEARARLYSVWVNDVDQGFGTGIRVTPGLDYVTNLTSPRMACNLGGNTPAPAFVEANAGDTVCHLSFCI
jgi:hypothetical protein